MKNMADFNFDTMSDDKVGAVLGGVEVSELTVTEVSLLCITHLRQLTLWLQPDRRYRD